MKNLLLGSTGAVALVAAMGAAHAAPLLYISTSTYAGNAQTVMVGEPLPISPAVAAIADGSFPGVFSNDGVDGNFGVTSPILLSAYSLVPGQLGTVGLGPLQARLNITDALGIVTSFSSKSELALHTSTDGTAITLMGYVAGVNALDVSNSNTPANVDPSNTDVQTPTYRAVVEVDLGTNGLPAGESATPVGAYSGNNGRGAILAENIDGTGQNEYLMVGNAGNGSGIPPTDIVNDTGVQAITPGSTTPVSTVIGTQQGSPGNKDGFEYGFSVTELGDAADKSGKDDNFRGSTVFNNTLYVTKGSGGNGVNTVYQVLPSSGGLPTEADGPTTAVSILPGLPTNLATNIVEGDPKTEFYPFDVWFANATTMYVADEGSQDLNADPNAGIQKWVFNGSQWVLQYVLQSGLNLDQTYPVPNYPVADHPATTGVRHLAGVVSGNTVTLFATTATYSNMGDPGGDPNAVVRVVDTLNATTAPASARFSVVAKPAAGTVYRGLTIVNNNG